MGQNRFTIRDIGISLLALFLITGFVVLSRQKTPAFRPQAASIPETPAPAPLPVNSIQSVHSPDGTMKLVMQRTATPGATESAYTFDVSDISGANKHTIYTATLPMGTELTLPANSFSPDNRFVFILGRQDNVMSAFVFLSDGTFFPDGKAYTDVGSLFRSQLPDLSIRDVTGWDDPSLLHVTTKNSDGSVGQSYWFDIWSRSFLELGRKG